MYKTILILISLTLSLTSCYTQFSTGNTSKPYIPDVQQYNYDDNDNYESSDYYEGQYEPVNETEYNIYYYGSPWYGDYYYYPSWGFYTGWYTPYYSPGFICYPTYPNYYWNDGGYYTPIERTPRSFDKGRANRNIPKKIRTPRPNRGSKTPGNEAIFTDLSSGNVIAAAVGQSGNTQDISSSSERGNKGHVTAVTPSNGHQNRPKSKTVSTAAKHSKKRRIYYTPGRSTSKSTAKRSIGSTSKRSGKSHSGSHRNYKSAVKSGGGSSSYLSSRSGSSSSVHRSSSSSVSRSSSSSSSRLSGSSSKVSSRSRRHR